MRSPKTCFGINNPEYGIGHLQAIIDTSNAASGKVLTMRFDMVYSKKVTE